MSVCPFCPQSQEDMKLLFMSVFAVGFCMIESHVVESQIANFVKCNTAKYVSIVSFDQRVKVATYNLYKRLSEDAAYVSLVDSEEVFAARKREGDFFIVPVRREADLKPMTEFVVREAHNFTQKSFMLVVNARIDEPEQERIIRETTTAANKNSLYFFASPNENGQMLWKQVISVQSQPHVSVDNVEFRKQAICLLLRLQLCFREH